MVRSMTLLPSCRHLRLLVLSFAAALLLALPLGAAAQDLDDSRKNLERLEKRIRQAQKSLATQKDKAGSLLGDLKEVEGELDRIQGRLSASRKRLAQQKAAVARAHKEVSRLQGEVAEVEQQVHQRLAAMYKGGERGLLHVFFTSAAPARMAEEYLYLRRIVQRDRELIRAYRIQAEALNVEANRLETLRIRQQQTVEAMQQDEKGLRQAQRLKKEVLRQVKKDEKAAAALLEDLQERARQLSALIKKLESKKSAEYSEKTTLFSKQAGRLSWPVKGPLQVRFGTGRHSELGTLYESHGIEIGAAPRSGIKAVWPGRVAFASWFKGYGNLVIVDHGDSYHTLYAQAEQLTRRVNDQVQQGDLLGYSGFGGGEVVYFEIRHKGTPLDPEKWLKR